PQFPPLARDVIHPEVCASLRSLLGPQMATLVVAGRSSLSPSVTILYAYIDSALTLRSFRFTSDEN
ncbi:hypothetical protein, partial [Mesorhizobium sp. M1E.F.Ca.ET.063.01.1.1]|uniref:hypothetical protein n=1 Tax=Mesorhizobium sp. M1E.F.Ca.ET.063.01.1.1 TaxID=2496750 RepID=UPI001AECA87C